MRSVVLMPDECRVEEAKIRPWIEAAMSYSAGERTVDQILELLYVGKAQCWVVLSGEDIVNVATTEIIDYPNKRVLHIITSTGIDWENHKQEHKELEDFAKALGCQSISVWGRRGWERKLHTLGYEHTYSVFEKKIQEE